MTGDPVKTVAIVHDYLNQRGGAERVVLEMAQMWPQAPIYTSIYRPGSTFPEFASHEVRRSPLDRFPLDKGFRALLPFYPAAFRSFGVLEQDLVVSSSSGWAHGVRTASSSFHVVYCHTPARWLYDRPSYIPFGPARVALTPLLTSLSRWDRRAAGRADLYIANSANVQGRIRSVYGIEADVVHPPVDTERFTPRPRGERLLVVSRLLPYKRVDLVVRAATKAGLPLDVVGTGPSLPDLRAVAGPNVTFHGRTADGQVVEMMESCRALVVPGVEDFGIVAVEAQAAGKPVVAFAGGGVLETVQDGVTGAFFHEQSLDAMIGALQSAEALHTSPDEIARHAARFSRATFRGRIVSVIESARSRDRERDRGRGTQQAL